MPNKVEIKIDYSAPLFKSGFELGITHTARGLDNCGHPEANARGSALLADACRLHNAHIQGWGVKFPEVSPGVWDWSSLDRRINYIRSIGGMPIITLCAAPDWMKGPYDPAEEAEYLAHGQRWWWFEKAPLPEYFEDFAKVCVQVAKRYPDVRYYQVWNEMKGFVYEDRDRQFDNHIQFYYEEYTQFYNLIYNALKSHDPDLQVGGFYPVLGGMGIPRGDDYYSMHPIVPHDREAMMYWLEHKAGADFICVDRGMTSWWSPYKDTYTPDEVIDSAVEFQNIMEQIHEVCDLPIWWSEYYFAGEKGSDYAMACATAQLCHMVLGRGETKALLWNPIDSEGLNGPLFSSNMEADGCQPTRYYEIWRNFNKDFSAGRDIYTAEISRPDLAACLASDKALVIANKRNEELEATINGAKLTLAPYQVLFIK
ncbi:MAG: hypothetical protein IIW23_01020 [Clostridia bacterium]|nr:hypothetical protein [Clostridia bacterium]